MSVKHLREALGLAAGTLVLVLGSAPAAAEVVISQVYGGGGNTGATLKNDFIELFNNGGAAVSLSGWSLQYASSTGTSWQRTNLSGNLQPGQYFLVQQASGAGGTAALPTPDASGSIAMSATAGKVALTTSTTLLTGSCPSSDPSLVDLVGFGSANCAFAAPTAAPSNTAAALRKTAGCSNSRNNSADFAIAAPGPRNSATALNSCGGAPVATAPRITAAASPASVLMGESTLITAAIQPGSNPASTGIVASVDLSSLGGSAAQTLYDDGSHGDATAGDLTFSYSLSISAGTAGGSRSLSLLASDAEGRSASASLNLSVVALQPISAIQGSGSSSPLVGSTVVTQGVVTGVKSNGFYLQTPDGQDDGNPATSEGVFVFTSSRPNAAVVALRHQVRVQAKVVEYQPEPGQFPLTELSNASISLLATGQALPAPIALSLLDAGPQSARDALERLEGMRVAADCLDVVAPTLGSINESSASSSANGVFYSVLCGVQRPLREPGLAPTDRIAAPAGTPRFDGNPELLRIDSKALGGSSLTLDVGALLTQVSGVMDYAFGAYSILPDANSSQQLTPGLPPRAVAAPGYETFTVSGFNLLRFFDDQNDPAIGEPVLTSSAYAFRLTKTAHAICDYLHAPDILGVVEVESLSVLSRLAAEINTSCPSAPHYSAHLLEGNDVGGIDIGFLVSEREVKPGLPRVSLRSILQVGKDTVWTQPDGTSALLNDRPSLLLEATVNQDNGAAFPLTVIANHLRSLSGANGDDANGVRVRAKRLAQAQFLAQLIEDRQNAHPDERLLLVGDFNAFEFNDGLVDSMGIITGYPAGANAVATYGSSPITRPLRNLTLDEAVEERYSFSFDGNAQTLDHLLVNQPLRDAVQLQVDHARLNADFSEARFGDASSDARVSDHDPVIAYLTVADFRSTDLRISAEASAARVRVGSPVRFVLNASNAGPSTAAAQIRFDLPAAAQPQLRATATGWTCVSGNAGARTQFVCNTAAFTPTSQRFEIDALATDALGGGNVDLQAQISGEARDPRADNNSAQTQVAVDASAALAVSLSAPFTPIITGRGADFVATVSHRGGDAAWSPLLRLAANASADALAVQAPAGWNCAVAQTSTEASRIDCRFTGAFANAAVANFVVRVNPPRQFPRSQFELSAEVASSTPDPDGSDNRANAAQRVTGQPGFGG